MNLAEIALLFFQTKYTWGGNTREYGFDCSGLVCECLRSIGKLDKRDLTAQGIYDRYAARQTSSLHRNAILFFGESVEKITHIAIALNPTQMIEAGGEGRVETKNGYVRIRPISNRSDLVAAIRI